MKKLICLLAPLCLGACLSNAFAAAPELPRFIHGTYSVQELLRNDELEHPGYDAFQFIYLMATPDWPKLDFDASAQEVLRYADEFDYAKEPGSRTLVPEVIRKAHESGAKVLLSFGGHEIFDPVMKNAERQPKFVDYMVRLVENNDYDGVDIDWEITLDKEIHADMMIDLRNKLNKLSERTGKYYFLTTALSIDHVYDQPLADKLASTVDWINIMSYDMCGGVWGSIPSHNTSMEVMRSKLAHWNTFDKQQLCLGLANYGFYYKGLKPGQNAGESLSKYGRYITYNEFAPLLEQGWTEEYDPQAEVSYYFSPDKTEFVTIDSPSSIRSKSEWMTANGYRGAFWWEFHHDYRTPNQTYSHPLIDVATKYFREYLQAAPAKLPAKVPAKAPAKK